MLPVVAITNCQKMAFAKAKLGIDIAIACEQPWDCLIFTTTKLATHVVYTTMRWKRAQLSDTSSWFVMESMTPAEAIDLVTDAVNQIPKVTIPGGTP